MMAVGLSSSGADKYLKRVAAELGDSRLVVACVNSPKNVTVSGEAAHIKHLQAVLEAGQIFARELKVNVAYHSFQMREMADEYLHKLGSLDKPHGLSLKNVPLVVSSVTGNEISRDELSDPKYWVRNLVSPVLFSQALATICSNTSSATSPSKTTTLKLDGSHRRQISISDMVEVGPHSALQGPIREILLSISQDRVINYLSMLVRNTSAVHSTLELAGRLYCLGYPIDVECVNGGVVWTGKSRVSARPRKSLTSLPDYPFNHSKSYWTESRLSKNYRFRKHARHDLLGVQATDWNPLEAKWRNIIKISELPWAEDHKINGTVLYPAAGMLVMAIEACKQLADETKELAGFLFKNVSFHSALNIPATSSGIEVNLCVRPRKEQDEKDAGWHEYVTSHSIYPPSRMSQEL
jgi:acyl transferase domain-containing protein